MYELGTDGPRQILVGVDGSDSSLKAGAYAVGLARRQGSGLVALYVAPNVGMPSAIAATAGVALPAREDSHAVWLEELVLGRTRDLGVQVEFLRRVGSPYEQMVAVADELRIEAIVVGAAPSAGHRTVGSLTRRLVRQARWPVIIVP